MAVSGRLFCKENWSARERKKKKVAVFTVLMSSLPFGNVSDDTRRIYRTKKVRKTHLLELSSSMVVIISLCSCSSNLVFWDLFLRETLVELNT